MSPFKGRQYPGEVILQAVRWYLRYGLSETSKSCWPNGYRGRRLARGELTLTVLAELITPASHCHPSSSGLPPAGQSYREEVCGVTFPALPPLAVGW